jgi:hypothetical protein
MQMMIDFILNVLNKIKREIWALLLLNMDNNGQQNVGLKNLLKWLRASKVDTLMPNHSVQGMLFRG